jgi:PBP1b-binding outer membrane lipoprotein LpoB
MKKLIKVSIVGLAFLLLSACSTGEDVPEYDEPDTVDEVEDRPENS